MTKAPTLESTDSLDIVCFAELGEERRPPLKSRDYCSWSSQSSTPSLLSVPAFHSADCPDFENRPRTTSPSDDSASHTEFTFPEIVTEMDSLTLSAPSSFVPMMPPLSPRKLEQLFVDTPPSPSVSNSSRQGDVESAKMPCAADGTASDEDTALQRYHTTIYHEIYHTIPLPKTSVSQDGVSTVPTILHKLATVPSGDENPVTIHLEIPPLYYEESYDKIANIDNNNRPDDNEFLDISPKQMDLSDGINKEDWTGETRHHNAPFYWDIPEQIPVFPLYRDGHFTTGGVPDHESLVPRLGSLHDTDPAMPSFDEICSKAGRLIQNLERTVSIERFVPVDPAPVAGQSEIRYTGGSGGNGGVSGWMNGMQDYPGAVVVVNVVDHAGNSTGHNRYHVKHVSICLLCSCVYMV